MLTCQAVPLGDDERQISTGLAGSGLTVIFCVPPAATVPLAGVMTAQSAPDASFSTALACQLTATVLWLLSSVSACGGGGVPFTQPRQEAVVGETVNRITTTGVGVDVATAVGGTVAVAVGAGSAVGEAVGESATVAVGVAVGAGGGRAPVWSCQVPNRPIPGVEGGTMVATASRRVTNSRAVDTAGRHPVRPASSVCSAWGMSAACDLRSCPAS